MKPEYEVTNKLISLVNEAAALVESKGETAFVNSPYREANGAVVTPISLFRIGIAPALFIPIQNSLEKTSLNPKDMNGNPFIRSILKKVSGKNKAG